MKKSVIRLCFAAAFLVSIVVVVGCIFFEFDRVSGVDPDPAGKFMGAAHAAQGLYMGLLLIAGGIYSFVASFVGFFVSLFSAKKAFNRTIYIVSVVLVGAHAVTMSVMTAFLIYMFF